MGRNWPSVSKNLEPYNMWVNSAMLSNRMIDRTDLKIFNLVDTPQEVVSIINKFYTSAKRSV